MRKLLLIISVGVALYTEGYQMGYCAKIAETNQTACEDISEKDVERSKKKHANDAEYRRGFTDGTKKYQTEVTEL